MIIKPGDKYYLRYKKYHVDPLPYLYVISSDRKYVTGFNIHYLPNIKFRIPVDIYKKQPEERFIKAFNTMRIAGLFRGFLEKLEAASRDQGMSRKEYKTLAIYLMDKYPWSQKCFRKYFKKHLRIRNNIQWPQ